MQVISPAPPCPSKHASASTFSTMIVYLLHIYNFIFFYLYIFFLYCELHEICLWLKSCLFEMSKLIKHMLNSLSGAGRLVFKKKKKLELNKNKMFQSCF